MSSTTLPPAGSAAALITERLPILRVFGELPFHTDGVPIALAFAKGSLWSVEEPGVLRRWHLGTGQMLDWKFLSDLETLWTFSSDGSLLVSASDDLSLWDVESGRLLMSLPQPSWVTAAAFGPDNQWLVTGHDDGIVRLWDLTGRRLAAGLSFHERPISAVALRANGAQVAAAGEDKLISLWDVKTGQLVGSLSGHTDRIPALAWHPTEPRLYSAGWDTTVRIWNTATLQPIILLNSHATQVTSLALSGQGSVLACADSRHSIHLWDTTTHQQLAVLKGHNGEIRSVAFSADGQRLASGGEDRVLMVRRAWEQTASRASRSEGMSVMHVYIPTRLALNPDASRLATTNSEKGLRIWTTALAQLVTPREELGNRHSVAYSRDGRWLAAGGDHDVTIWEVSSGRKHAVLEGPAQPVTVLAFSPDSSTLAAAGHTEEAVWLWNVETGEPCLLIPDAIDGCTVEALAFNPTGELLAVGGIDWMATGGSDGAVSIWNLAEKCEITTFGTGVTSVAYHPSGRLIAGATLNRTVSVWDPDSRQRVLELTGHDDAVACVAYSPNGRWLATGSDDHTVRLWDAHFGACLGSLELDTQIKTLIFSADNRYLFSGNGNTSCYQLEVARLLEEIE